MKRMNEIAAACGTLALTLTGCLDNTAVSPPMGGGKANQPYSCSVGALSYNNNACVRARLTGQRDLPKQCPFLVDMQSSVDFQASMYGPKETTPASGGADLDGVFSVYDGIPVVSNQHRYYYDDPNVSTGRTVQFSGTYTAGHVQPQVNFPWSHDSGTVTAQTIYGDAKAYLTMSGGNRAYGANIAPTLVVPAIYTGSAATLRAETEVDTNSYSFDWVVDGVSIAHNDARLTYAFSLPGNHSVTASAHYLTGTETISATVYSAFYLGISGPPSIDPNDGGTWSAYIPGGYPPYSYQWYFDGSPAGNGSSYSTTWGPSQNHTIGLYVSDSHGFNGYQTMDVWSSAGGTCLDPPCP
jgi:hypothetical protein